jgi:hypothetical protein
VCKKTFNIHSKCNRTDRGKLEWNHIGHETEQIATILQID